MSISIQRLAALGFGLTIIIAGTMGTAQSHAPAVVAPTAMQQVAPIHPTQPQTTTQQEPNSPPAGATVLHTGTQLVIVDVTVRDKKGNPVHGIKREDFTISEAKQPQTLRAFDEYATPATPPVIPPAPKLTPGSFTNYTPVPAKGPLNVMLIDALNTPLADQGYLIAQMQKYMKTIKPGTRLAIFGLSGHLYFLQGFTGDPKVLQAAFDSIKNGKVSTLLPNSSTDNAALGDSMTLPGTAEAASSNVSALATGAITDMLNEMANSQTASRSIETIQAFIALGKWLANFPGRKNLIWFSGSFPLSIDVNANGPNEDSTIFQLMVNTLTQAQVSVYPVDPRGVQGSPSFHVDDTSLSQTSAFYTRNSAFNASKDAEHSTMQAFASDTGGKPFYNDNFLGVAVDEALNDGANYYTLAYSPSDHKTGGEWRSIQVALNGNLTKEGYTLSYRRGYYAENSKHPDYKTGTGTVAASNFTAAQQGHNYVYESMTRGAPLPTDILFTARVLPHTARPDDTLAADNMLDPKSPMPPPYRRFDVDVAAMPHYFTLIKQANGNYAGAIEVKVNVYTPDGKLINTTAKKLTLNLTQDAYERFIKNAVGVHLEVSAPAEKDSVLRIGFQDMPSNHIGAVEVATSVVKNLPPLN